MTPNAKHPKQAQSLQFKHKKKLQNGKTIEITSSNDAAHADRICSSVCSDLLSEHTVYSDWDPQRAERVANVQIWIAPHHRGHLAAKPLFAVMLQREFLSAYFRDDLVMTDYCYFDVFKSSLLNMLVALYT